MRHRSTLNLLFATSALMAAGCAAPAPTPTPTSSSNSAAMQAADAGGFRVVLGAAAISGRRTFPVPEEYRIAMMSGAFPASWGVDLSMLVIDTRELRLFRVAEASAITSVLDDQGRELLRPGDGVLRPANQSQRPAFVAPQAKATSGYRERPSNASWQVHVAASPIPRAISRIRGQVIVDVVSNDSDATLPAEPTAEPQAVAPATTATLKLLDTDPKTGAVRRATVEILSTVAESAPAASSELGPLPLIQSVEIVDASGTVLATLGKREETLVDTTLRRRFTLDQGQGQRYGGEPQPPKAIRIHMITALQRITIPFEWGPVELTDPAPAGAAAR